MKLFHFTAGQFLAKIQAGGLRKGVIPWSMDEHGRVGFVPGFQWLTRNPNFGMEWARPSPFSTRIYRTDEFRLTVEIPTVAEVRLFRWVTLRDARNPESRIFLDTFPDHADWFLFKGSIPPNWIVGHERNPFPESLVIPINN